MESSGSIFQGLSNGVFGFSIEPKTTELCHSAFGEVAMTAGSSLSQLPIKTFVLSLSDCGHLGNGPIDSSVCYLLKDYSDNTGTNYYT